MASNRIIVHVSGIKAGQVEIDVHPNFLPLLPYDVDDPVIPEHFCGIRIRRAGEFLWQDESGNLIEAENHGDVSAMGDEYYLGGIEFTGPLTSCDSNAPWYFPVPLSYGGNGPQFEVARLIIQLDGSTVPIEFIDHNHEPVEIPDYFDDLEEIPGSEEWLEEICAEHNFPELCEADDSEDPEVPEGGGSVLDGTNNLVMELDPIVDPPPIGSFEIKDFEPSTAVAVNLLRADLAHFKALKALIDEVGVSSFVKKSLSRELHEVERYARLVAVVQESSKKLFQEALNERENVKIHHRRAIFIAYYRMLFYWYTGFNKFGHYALNLDRTKKDIRKGKRPEYLPEMLEDIEKSIELLEKASAQIYTFNRLIWPVERGYQVFKVERKQTGE